MILIRYFILVMELCLDCRVIIGSWLVINLGELVELLVLIIIVVVVVVRY